MREQCSACGGELRETDLICPTCGATILRSPASGVQSPYPQQPLYQQNMPYPYPVRQSPSQGMAVASLVMSILSWVLCPVVFAIVGLIFGLIARSNDRTNGMALAGVVVSIINIVIWVLFLVFYVFLIGVLMNSASY